MEQKDKHSLEELLNVDIDSIALEGKKQSRRKKKKIMMLILVFIVIGIISFLTYSYIRIKITYQEAVSKQQEGKYDDAIILFQDLGEYKDSKAQVIETKYQKALYAQSGDYGEAIALFEELGEYKDSKEQVIETRYRQALYAQSKKDFDKAITLFEELGEYKDSKEQVIETRYQQALDIQSKKDYDEAITLFGELGEYKNSKEQIKETIYRKAIAKLEEENYDEAVTLFNEMGEYKDQIPDRLYNEGIAKWKSGKYDVAVILLEQVKGYSDSDILLKYLQFNGIYMKPYQFSDGTTDDWGRCIVIHEKWLQDGIIQNVDSRKDVILSGISDHDMFKVGITEFTNGGKTIIAKEELGDPRTFRITLIENGLNVEITENGKFDSERSGVYIKTKWVYPEFGVREIK